MNKLQDTCRTENCFGGLCSFFQEEEGEQKSTFTLLKGFSLFQRLHFNRFGDSGRVSLPVHEGSVLPTAETSREAYRVGSRARVPPPGSALLQQLASQPRPRPPEGGEGRRAGWGKQPPPRPALELGEPPPPPPSPHADPGGTRPGGGGGTLRPSREAAAAAAAARGEGKQHVRNPNTVRLPCCETSNLATCRG
ncbi:uncharacterized protein [Equus asinus]|uniref:uncharacterized protein n=1 Tax=Equus asinus TaxID=9793 RepID=UPI0038F6F537